MGRASEAQETGDSRSHSRLLHSSPSAAMAALYLSAFLSLLAVQGKSQIYFNSGFCKFQIKFYSDDVVEDMRAFLKYLKTRN